MKQESVRLCLVFSSIGNHINSDEIYVSPHQNDHNPPNNFPNSDTWVGRVGISPSLSPESFPLSPVQPLEAAIKLNLILFIQQEFDLFYKEFIEEQECRWCPEFKRKFTDKLLHVIVLTGLLVKLKSSQLPHIQFEAFFYCELNL